MSLCSNEKITCVVFVFFGQLALLQFTDIHKLYPKTYGPSPFTMASQFTAVDECGRILTWTQERDFPPFIVAMFASFNPQTIGSRGCVLVGK